MLDSVCTKFCKSLSSIKKVLLTSSDPTPRKLKNNKALDQFAGYKSTFHWAVKTGIMASHAELVAELPKVNRMCTEERYCCKNCIIVGLSFGYDHRFLGKLRALNTWHVSLL